MDVEVEREGRIARNLFRSDSDTSSSESNTSTNISGIDTKEETAAVAVNTDHPNGVLSDDDQRLRRTHMGGVLLEERIVGGSIAQRLWPAAEFLASFVLEQYPQSHEIDVRERVKARGISESSAVHVNTVDAIPTSSQSNLQPNERQTCCVPVTESIGVSRHPSTIVEQELNCLRKLLRQSLTSHHINEGNELNHDGQPLTIVELGAGLGLTGIALATHLVSKCRILLTDLDDALPLLRTNISLNQENWIYNGETSPTDVIAQRLAWGDDIDCRRALDWCFERPTQGLQESLNPREMACSPILILGADCVYWESLHEPLTQTLVTMLSQAPIGSVCLLAGMRRWKRDNMFYRTLHKRSKSSNGHLSCTCLREDIARPSPSQSNDDASSREIMRVFSVRWISFGCQA